VYDLGSDGQGPLVSRQGHLVRSTGDSTVHLTLWGADWKLKAGDRIGVRVTDNNQDWWLMASPTFQDVTVRGGSITLPFLRYRRTQTIQGDPGVQLADYLDHRTAQGPGDAVSTAGDCSLPPAPAEAPAGSVPTRG